MAINFIKITEDDLKLNLSLEELVILKVLQGFESYQGGLKLFRDWTNCSDFQCRKALQNLQELGLIQMQSGAGQTLKIKVSNSKNLSFKLKKLKFRNSKNLSFETQKIRVSEQDETQKIRVSSIYNNSIIPNKVFDINGIFHTENTYTYTGAEDCGGKAQSAALPQPHLQPLQPPIYVQLITEQEEEEMRNSSHDNEQLQSMLAGKRSYNQGVFDVNDEQLREWGWTTYTEELPIYEEKKDKDGKSIRVMTGYRIEVKVVDNLGVVVDNARYHGNREPPAPIEYIAQDECYARGWKIDKETGQIYEKRGKKIYKILNFKIKKEN